METLPFLSCICTLSGMAVKVINTERGTSAFPSLTSEPSSLHSSSYFVHSWYWHWKCWQQLLKVKRVYRKSIVWCPLLPLLSASEGGNGPWVHEEYKLTPTQNTCIYARGLKDIFYDPSTATLLFIQCLEERLRLLQCWLLCRACVLKR